MKLKFTTKLFITANVFIILFRTIQIMFLTEAKTAFLIKSLIAINVIGVVLGLLLLTMLFSNTINALRQPKGINYRSPISAAVSFLSGLLLIVSGAAAFVEQDTGSKYIFIVSLLGALSFILYGASCFLDYVFPKIAAIPLIIFTLSQIIFAYMFYIGRALRVRTVYEVLALIFSILFFGCFGKIIAGLNKQKNLRLLYPLGLVGASLCFVSFVPELIASIFGFSSRVATASVSPLVLAAAGIFMMYFTLNTFKKSNTFRPKRKHSTPPTLEQQLDLNIETNKEQDK